MNLTIVLFTRLIEAITKRKFPWQTYKASKAQKKICFENIVERILASKKLNRARMIEASYNRAIEFRF